MRPKTYPLDPLLRVRRDEATARTKQLAGAVATREEAAHARLRLEAAREAERARAAGVRAAEAGALDRGDLAAVDLQRQAAWEARVRWEDDEAARRVREATERERAAQVGEAAAKAGAAAAEAATKVVSEHRARWDADRVRAAEVAAEEDAAEAWRPR
jgi:hypothetical protein